MAECNNPYRLGSMEYRYYSLGFNAGREEGFKHQAKSVKLEKLLISAIIIMRTIGIGVMFKSSKSLLSFIREKDPELADWCKNYIKG